MSDWPFCDSDSVPTGRDEPTPPTVCYGASSALETGSYLDATLLVRGPSSAAPVERESTATIIGSGKRYGMSGGSADATLVMSEWVRTDDYGWTKVIIQFFNTSDMENPIDGATHG